MVRIKQSSINNTKNYELFIIWFNKIKKNNKYKINKNNKLDVIYTVFLLLKFKKLL
jgi:hypothetical protein